MVELRIDDYADPRAEKVVTIQSFKRQMTTEGHYPVQYGVATNFPGTITLRWATGSAAVTDGSRVTTWLNEGTMVVTADATGVAVANGMYYLFLLQDESQKELQVAIVVDLEYYAIPELGISSAGGSSQVTVVAADPCSSPQPLYSLDVAGYSVQMARAGAILPLWGDDLMVSWKIIRDGPGEFRKFSIVPFPFAIANTASQYCTLTFYPRVGENTSHSFYGAVPVPSFSWSRVGDELVISTSDFLRCSCQWLAIGAASIALGCRISVLPPDSTAVIYGVTLSYSGISKTFDKSGLQVKAEESFDFLKRIATGDAPSFSHETIPYIQRARVTVQVAVNIAMVSSAPQRFNHNVISSLP